ncbi:alkene reductase [Acinetobacter ursingii]|uniref:alkene reductase n=1 Tax=Acinetobacter ursingii TaxID=108980 RepID=UPI00124C468B|nr:alkene reductase [Acinetobacter ursingii]MCU4307155.1 alkene reductase [Acinetobacter ursingii]MCU4373172.1 alkene reductase [Acinetobacter ursingii]MCU4382798.1 alkene reductase [Acinetobacter ursingii]MDG9993742.1 alkene reductase [Acinetobacter ursingii]MDH0205933.1 alkene reductase [Acinetobacter ursingii]
MAELNSPLKIGDFEIKNRLVMAPLTRARSGETRVPNQLMQEYYAQRANAGLILTEATVIAPKAVGYAETPGLWSEQQAQAWQPIIEAVHAQGSKMVVQLWHVGRISHPDLLDGDTPVAPSAIQPAGHVSLLRPKRPYVTPRALSIEEIQEIVAQYKHAAELAKVAGFDGVELHAANGYLIDQFLQSTTNQREDEYGGSLENRARLLLQVVDAFIEVWGAGRVGVHIAPRADSHDMGDANPLETFGYVMQQLSQRQIAFVFSREYQAEDSISPQLRQQFTGAWIANENLTPESAKQLLASGEADAVSFGKAYIANPDLLTRLEKNLPFNELNPETIYAKGALGYTDYPALAEHTLEA